MPNTDIQTQIDDLTRQRKNYTSDSPEAAELSRKIQELKQRLTELKADPSPSLPPPMPEDETARALHRTYLSHLLDTGGRLELGGIDRKAAGQRSESCLNLATIYTALLTRSTDALFGQEREKGQQLSVLDLVNRHKYLVLLGAPGSGKSTFARFLAICLAGELLQDSCANLDCLTAPLPDDEGQDREEKQHWHFGALLPIFVTLRDFAAEALPPLGQEVTVNHLWNFLCARLAELRLQDYAETLEDLLHTYGGLLLLDGLDEVPDAAQRRPQIRQLVEELRRAFPRCRILVTSRTYAYQEQDWRLPEFQDTELAPFTQGQIRRFIDRWYGNVAELRGQSHSHAQGQAELLKRAIFQNQRLGNFAERPLLLTLMASLHAWRGGSLPEQRAELYADATDLLLDSWEQSKVVRDREGNILVVQPSLTELLRIGKGPVEKVLHELAFQAHQSQEHLSGSADIPESDLVTALLTISDEDIKPKQLIKHLSERAGLLLPHGVGVYSFPHRSFQEYLAACWLSTQDDYPDNIAELACAEPNRWREVLLLAAARFSDAALMLWSLIEALCYQDVHGGGSDPRQAWGALLAGQVLLENTDLNKIAPRHQSKVTRIKAWLVAILTEQTPKDEPFPASERALAGNILAQLGDPRPGVGLHENSMPDVEWCEVPEGSFLMGSHPAKEAPEKLLKTFVAQNEQAAKIPLTDDNRKILYRAFLSEQPQHPVKLVKYQISRYPVTNMQYQAFVDGKGYQTHDCWNDEGWQWKEEEGIDSPKYHGSELDLANHPVVGVSWYEASAFCSWLTHRLREIGELSEGQEIRLPTEAEWEKAARGEDGWIYPWGDKGTDPKRANYHETGLGGTSPVGCFPQGKSPYEIEEMAGNAYEWCRDWYAGDYYAKSPAENPMGPASGLRRVMRGGNWSNIDVVCRAAFRNVNKPGYRDRYVGFRLLRT